MKHCNHVMNSHNTSHGQHQQMQARSGLSTINQRLTSFVLVDTDWHTLLQDAAEAQVDPFVELELADPDPNSDTEVHTSPIIMNEASPRWNIKYDYIMVSATSTLTAVVYDKQGLFDGVLALPKVLLGKTFCSSDFAVSEREFCRFYVCNQLQKACRVSRDFSVGLAHTGADLCKLHSSGQTVWLLTT